jgi:acetyl-CoA carboxylase carboxyltransferase component
MGAHQAVGVTHRRELAAAEDPARTRAKLADAYAAQHLSADNAARGGHVDEVVRPGETRTRLALALATLGARTGDAGRVRNIPL